MSDLLSYLAAQARTQPATTLRFVAGEVWRRSRARLQPALADGVAELGTSDFHRLAPLFTPAEPHTLRKAKGAAWVAATLERAQRISRGDVEVFGDWIALGREPDWQRDWKSGYRWPLAAAGRLRILDAAPGADVKRPWEVARFHHGLALGAACVLTGDAAPAAAFAAQVRHWIEHNPWPRGIHWAMPMEVAVRAINWIQVAMLTSLAGHLDETFARELSRSLFLHGRHLFAYREWNPVARANHYLASVAGLVWLGALFEATSEGRQWLEFGRSELMNEMECQTGADGVAHEGSSSYHAFVTELFLSSALVLSRREAQHHAANGNLVRAIERATSPAFAERLKLMFEFLSALVAGREEPPVWGDADDGRVLPFGGGATSPVIVMAAIGDGLSGRLSEIRSDSVDAEIFWRLGGPPETAHSEEQHVQRNGAKPSRAFAESGFFFFSSPRVRGSLRCGPLGVRGWANHAHNDQLSLEFSLDGKPVLVDPGLPCYSDDPATRNLFRSTRYHNTIEVAGTEQNRFWPALLFRIVDDTRSRLEHWRTDDSVTVFAGLHSGYLRLPERVKIRREVYLAADDSVTVRDAAEAGDAVPLAWYFHFARGIRPTAIREGFSGGSTAFPIPAACTAAGMALHSQWHCGPMSLSVLIDADASHLDARVDEGCIAPRFGVKVAASILAFHGKFAGRHEVVFVFAPLATNERIRANGERV